jgi:hypothetical protein
MRFSFCLLLLGSFITSEVLAQTPTPSPTPLADALLLAELDRRRPDEVSPFFAVKEAESYLSSPEARRRAEQEGVAIYPNTASYDSADRIFGGFFRSLTRSVRFGPEKPASMLNLAVKPEPDFLLADRREISATLTITNHGRKLLRLFFPTTQRFDFVIRDSSGREVERWSNDRPFETKDGIVMINPNEKVEYSAFLPTRELQAGETYTLQAEIAGNAEFATSILLKPR